MSSTTTGVALTPGSLDSLHELARRGFPAEPYKRKAPAKRVVAQSGQRHMSLEQCSQEMGLTRERIRQIEKSALEKLRIYCDRQWLSVSGSESNSNNKIPTQWGCAENFKSL